MKRLDLFPITTKIENNELSIARINLKNLADEFNTPLYIYDKATLDSSVTEYKNALASYYGTHASVTYAGKAYLCTAIAQWTQLHNLTLDCTGEGEIHIALNAKVKRENILVHGVNKSDADLKSAIQHAGTIVVDNLTELERITQLFTRHSSLNLWLRLLPGVTVSTHHAHTQTGHHESKFGMAREEILQAAEFCKKNKMPLKGLHFHQGSNFRDPEPLIPAIDLALDIAKEIGFDDEWHFCPGGGWGVAYHEDELPHPSIEHYVKGICEAVIEGCEKRNLSLPHLHLEPGRSLVARAGVAIYRVGAIKKRENKTWVLVDGGMADNPRYAMYGARYSCLAVSGVTEERSEVISVAGPYCESGDVIFEDLPMSKLKTGDLIAVPMSGAYHLSMSSNYNGARKPAVYMLENGEAKLIQKRETLDDLLRRDVKL
ncbi:MAG TPA: diaminopimelate decarboxylase [Anaerolineae bacterium]|nr:diaminopimelate decarboxylase [Anaerolineae bacterium]HCK66664.1 diaminopimelate decarboxylase [Anaerolineae bacterium]